MLRIDMRKIAKIGSNVKDLKEDLKDEEGRRRTKGAIGIGAVAEGGGGREGRG
jgi:hypothetical protein